ncbi:MAG: deoxyribodipyrimidine photolyase, partial [Burkholderiales bacterium PBB5]
MTSVVWFKRDLRLHDHAPLLRAARRGPLVALHITEPSLWDSPLFDAGHAEFIAQSLAALAEALAQRGGRLVRRYGEAVPVLQALHQATGFTQLFSHEEIGQRLTWDRDKAVAAWCRARGV